MEKIKNLIIIMLLVLSIYQTSNIWYDFSIQNLFVRTNEKEKEVKASYDEYILKPNLVMVSFGNNQYTEIKTTVTGSAIIDENVNKIYDKIFKSKVAFEVSNETIRDITKRKSVILTYKNIYGNNRLLDILGIKNDNIKEKIDDIKEVVICPEASASANIDIYLISSAEDIIKTSIHVDIVELYDLIEELSLFAQTNIYVSTEDDASKKFFDMQNYIPVHINDYTYEEQIPILTRPLEDEDKREKYVSNFFANPKAKWTMKKNNGIVLYGDGEKTIRVYEDGMIEYTATSNKSDNVTLNDAYKIAREFIDKDMYISNEIYLSGIKYLGNNAYRFSFDYRINGETYISNCEFRDKIGLNSQIEIIISNGKVTEYKRVVEDINLEVNPNTYNFKGYNDAINEYLSRGNRNLIHNMTIGYYKDTSSDDIELSWIIYDGYNNIFVPALEVSYNGME